MITIVAVKMIEYGTIEISFRHSERGYKRYRREDCDPSAERLADVCNEMVGRGEARIWGWPDGWTLKRIAAWKERG